MSSLAYLGQADLKVLLALLWVHHLVQLHRLSALRGAVRPRGGAAHGGGGAGVVGRGLQVGGGAAGEGPLPVLHRVADVLQAVEDHPVLDKHVYHSRQRLDESIYLGQTYIKSV